MSTSITTERCQLCDFTVTSYQEAVDSSMVHHFCTEHTFKDADKYEKYMRIRHLIKRHPQEPNH